MREGYAVFRQDGEVRRRRKERFSGEGTRFSRERKRKGGRERV
jgi:hypothetical protein